jgi:hypothetical protein
MTKAIPDLFGIRGEWGHLCGWRVFGGGADHDTRGACAPHSAAN